MKLHRETLQYSEITPYIYLGSNMCCGTHFKKLTDLGITADIDLQADKEGYERPEGVEAFLWLPTMDHTAPSNKQLIIGIRTIQTLVASRTKVYVHCRFGHGRSPSLVVAYFMVEGMSFSEAYAHVKKHRPEIHLLPAQVTALEQFESYLAKNGSV